MQNVGNECCACLLHLGGGNYGLCMQPRVENDENQAPCMVDFWNGTVWKQNIKDQVESNHKIAISELCAARFVVADLKLKNGEVKRVLVTLEENEQRKDGGRISVTKPFMLLMLELERGIDYCMDITTFLFPFIVRKKDRKRMPITSLPYGGFSGIIGKTLNPKECFPDIDDNRCPLYGPSFMKLNLLGNNRSYYATFDLDSRTLYVVDFIKIDVDLSEFEFGAPCGSNDKFSETQGKKSPITFLEFDSKVGLLDINFCRVWKPSANSKLGIIRVPHNSVKLLHKIFYSCMPRIDGVSYTNYAFAYHPISMIYKSTFKKRLSTIIK